MVASFPIEVLPYCDFDPSRIDVVTVGGLDMARLDIEQTARLMIRLGRAARRPEGPVFLTSANSEVLARRNFDRAFAAILDEADLVSADGQPLVFASRLFSRTPLPERVATTDLYPVAARMAERAGLSFYLFGAREEVNRAAYDASKRQWPQLDIRGRSHGYLADAALLRKLDEINEMAPDILWLSLGVPLEHHFVHRHARRLCNVKVIKTSGGLLDFVAGAKPRAPVWMRKAGFEWAYRMALEPRRLFMRYLKANPVAFFLLLTQTR